MNPWESSFSSCYDMTSNAATLTSFFTVFHYTFVYTIFTFITMLDGLIMRVAGHPAGQKCIHAADSFLVLLSEAVHWPCSIARTHNIFIFIPAFLVVQWWRLMFSIPLMVFGNSAVSGKDIQRVLKPLREMLDEVSCRGKQYQEMKNMEEIKSIEQGAPKEANKT